MDSEKAFLLSVIYKGRKFPQGAEAVEAPGGEKNAPAGGGTAVEAPRGCGKNAPTGGRQLWKPHPGGGSRGTPTQGARRLWKPRARAPRRELTQSHARRVVNLDT